MPSKSRHAKVTYWLFLYILIYLFVWYSFSKATPRAGMMRAVCREQFISSNTDGSRVIDELAHLGHLYSHPLFWQKTKYSATTLIVRT